MTDSAAETSQTTVEELTRNALGRFDLAFEVECHDKLEKLKTDWLIHGKISTSKARKTYVDLRKKWSMKRKIDLSVWPGLSEKSDAESGPAPKILTTPAANISCRAK